MSHKLTILQLWRSGFPVDPWTVAEELELRDFGPPPKGTTTTFERWTAWSRLKTEQAMEAAKVMAQFQAEMGLSGGGGGVPGDAGSGSGVPAGGGSGQAGQGGPGRPPSAQKPPEISAKGDGRPVISES